MMYTIIKIKSLNFIVFVCILVIIVSINTNYVVAQAKESTSTSSSSSVPSTSGSSCIQCPNESPKCPDCSSTESCVVTIRSCNKCPIARCESLSSNSLQGNNNSSSGGGNSSSSLIPAIVGSVVGVVALAVTGYGYFVLRKRSKSSNIVGNNNGSRSLDNFDEKETTLDSENVIPIAYIPPSTQSRVTSTLSDSRSFESSLYYASAGTTPLASPLPCTLNINNDDFCDEFRESGDIGTIIQATKAVATASNATATNAKPTTATLVTATRAKPALVRINTIRSNGLNDSSTSLASSSTSKNPPSPKKSGNSTPKSSSPTGNSFLSAINSLISSVPNSPTAHSESEMSIISIPKIDVEGSSFLHRESILSASSSNGRSTMLSDEGEIMIFWGGDNPTFIDIDGISSSSSPSAAKNDNNENKNDDDDNNNNNNNEDNEEEEEYDDINNDNRNSNRESNVSADN